MPTDLATEQAQQQRWRLRPEWARVPWFDQLLRNEFLSSDEQHALLTARLAAMLNFCGRNVPYYRDLFQARGIDPAAIRPAEDLAQLPLLRRADAQEFKAALQALALPPGHALGGYRKTSGSTGQPVVIQHTQQSFQLGTLLACRAARWFRTDPAGRLAAIRDASDLPRRPDGSVYGPGATCRLPAWPGIGRYFQTGDYLGFDSANPLDVQIDWLREHRPDRLLTLAACLEHLALTLGSQQPPASLRGIVTIAQTLTPAMRRRVEACFGVAINEDYGLNEIGVVAIRCPEGKRFHVNTEQCLVEIVDAHGQPVAPGEIGHLLVTALNNAAMPLLRYDTGDLAEAVESACPCGRTLPSFAGLRGRYTRVAFLPYGTMPHWDALERVLDLPPDHRNAVRQFQLYQFKDLSSELRVVAPAPLSAEFQRQILAAWDAVPEGQGGMPLRIVQMEEIPRGPSHKFERFVSEFTPPPDYR